MLVLQANLSPSTPGNLNTRLWPAAGRGWGGLGGLREGGVCLNNTSSAECCKQEKLQMFGGYILEQCSVLRVSPPLSHL